MKLNNSSFSYGNWTRIGQLTMSWLGYDDENGVRSGRLNKSKELTSVPRSRWRPEHVRLNDLIAGAKCHVTSLTRSGEIPRAKNISHNLKQVYSYTKLEKISDAVGHLVACYLWTGRKCTSLVWGLGFMESMPLIPRPFLGIKFRKQPKLYLS